MNFDIAMDLEPDQCNCGYVHPSVLMGPAASGNLTARWLIMVLAHGKRAQRTVELTNLEALSRSSGTIFCAKAKAAVAEMLQEICPLEGHYVWFKSP